MLLSLLVVLYRTAQSLCPEGNYNVNRNLEKGKQNSYYFIRPFNETTGNICVCNSNGVPEELSKQH
jgi:hypothetical protein